MRSGHSVEECKNLPSRTTPVFAKSSEHQQKHLLFDNSRTTSRRRKSTSGRNDASELHKGALTEYCQCQCHTRPYTRILVHRSRGVNILDSIRLQPLDPHIVARSRMRVNLNTVSSLQLIVSNLLFCWEFRGIRNTISKHVSHPYAPVIRLQGLLVQGTIIGKACGRSVPIVRPTTAIEEPCLDPSANARSDTWRRRKDKKIRQGKGHRAKCFSCLINKCVVIRTRTCPPIFACVLIVMVFRWYCLLARNKHVCNSVVA